jgi:hypothetical protein
VDHNIQPHRLNGHQKHTRTYHCQTSKSQLYNIVTEQYSTLRLAHAPANYTLQTFYYHTNYTRRKATHILREKLEATVPVRSTPQRQVDEHQTISSRHPLRRENTTKLPRNDGTPPMSILRFYADTYIITTHLNNTSITCIFSYLCSMTGSLHA